MSPWRRIRWTNVARAVALTFAVGMVVAWPRLGAEPPVVPDGTPTPIATPVATPVPVSGGARLDLPASGAAAARRRPLGSSKRSLVAGARRERRRPASAPRTIRRSPAPGGHRPSPTRTPGAEPAPRASAHAAVSPPASAPATVPAPTAAPSPDGEFGFER